MEVITHSTEETHALAAKVAQQLKLGMVLSLVGDLGAGKTTFTQGLGKALGIKRLIKSPTYTLVKEYPLFDGNLLHIDAYRLEDGGAMDLDLPSLMQPDTITVIEWAEFIQEDIPQDYLEIYISMQASGDRKISFRAVGDKPIYQEMIHQLSR